MRHLGVASTGSAVDGAGRKRLGMLIVLVAVTVCTTTVMVEALYIAAWFLNMVATVTWATALSLAVAANGVVLLAGWLAVRLLRSRTKCSEPEQVGEASPRQIPAFEALIRRFLPIVLESRPCGHRSSR